MKTKKDVKSMCDFIAKTFGWDKPAQVQVIHRESSKLTLAEFRSNEALCAESSKLMLSTHLQLMLQVMRNEHPGNTVVNADIPTRAILQARAEGYTMALANLEAMAVHQKPTPALMATFEKEESTVE